MVIKVRAPATIANLGSAFDCAGLAIDALHDEVSLREIKGKKVIIEYITGYDLPFEAEQNTASVAVSYMLKKLKIKKGIGIGIDKGIPPGSGLGSSAASSAAAVFGVNKLLKLGLKKERLIEFAMEGERMAAGVAHVDNVAPALLGNIVIGDSRRMIFRTIESPDRLNLVIILPDFSLNTKMSRKVLPKSIELSTGIKQWTNVAFLIEGLAFSDYDSIAAGLGDEIIEPARKKLIPNFDRIKKCGMKNGALGVTISGGGPSVFAAVKGARAASILVKKLNALLKMTDVNYRIYKAVCDREGSRVV